MKMKYSSSDFTNDSLPINRKQQLKVIFKNEWRTLFVLGLFFLATFLLYGALELLKSSVVIGIDQYKGTEYEESIALLTFYTEIVFNLATIIPFILFTLVLSGAGKVLQRLIYGEGLSFRSDFIYGIKNNFKQILLIAIIYSLLNAVTVSAAGILNLMGGSLEKVMSGLLTGIFYFIFSPMLFIASTLSITYKMKLKVLISNSFKIFMNLLLIPLLFGLIVFALKFLNAIPNILIIIAIQALLVFFLAPILILIWHLYLTSVFDKYINENVYDEIYLKGLRDYHFDGREKDENNNQKND